MISLRKKKVEKSEDPAILYQRNSGEKIIFAIIAVLLMVYCVTLLYPLLWLVINSLENPLVYADNLMEYRIITFPEKLEFINYGNAFKLLNVKKTSFFGMFWNSIWMTFTVSAVSVFMHSVTGYVFAKYNFKAKKVMYVIAIFCMTIPIVGTQAASMRLHIDLGLYNNPISRVVAGFGGFGSNFLIMLSIFESVPWSYAEAVFIDGGNDFQVFFKIMLPQAMPAMITLLVSAIIQHWKEYENILMYYPSYPTLSTGMYVIKGEISRLGYPVYYAGLVLSTIPIIILYMVSSDSMMKNLSVGGLKG